MHDTSMTGEDEELRRRVGELTRKFESEHPAKSQANKLVESLYSFGRDWDAIETRAGRERALTAAELSVAYDQLSSVMESASVELENVMYNIVSRLLATVYTLGKFDSPDGKAAHAARAGSGDHDLAMLAAAVGIYLDAHPELTPPKATPDYADAIRLAILDALGVDKNAKRPSVSAIRRAIRAVKRGTLKL